MNYYPYLLAVHIVFVVTWFAGLFYIVRLLIYHTEAMEKSEPEKTILTKQFVLMETRLMNIIATPSMYLALCSGTSLLLINNYNQGENSYIHQDWMQVKLLIVVLVITYHQICIILQNKLKKGIKKFSSYQLRMFNELATIFLVAIVFLVVLKSLLSMLYGLLGLFLLVIILMIAIKRYKMKRDKNN